MTTAHPLSRTVLPDRDQASRSTLDEVVTLLSAARSALASREARDADEEPRSRIPTAPSEPAPLVAPANGDEVDHVAVRDIRWIVMPPIWHAYASVVCDHVRRGRSSAPAWIERLADDLGTATQVRELRDRWRLSKAQRDTTPANEVTAPSALVRQAIASRLLLASFAGVRFVALGAAVGVSRRTAERLFAAHELATIGGLEMRQALAVSAERLASRMITCIGQPPA